MRRNITTVENITVCTNTGVDSKTNIVEMKRRFEEEVVEDTTTVTEETTESAPDSHEQFITILTEMGLSAEQAEAIHQMAMDLIENSPAESGEEVKVEASRTRRSGYSRGGSRRMGHGSSRPGSRRMGSSPRRRMSSERDIERGPRRSRRSPARRHDMGEQRMMRQLRRQRREISALKQQLTELGAQPGAGKVNTAPKTEMSAPTEVPTTGSPKDRVMAMLKHTF